MQLLKPQAAAIKEAWQAVQQGRQEFRLGDNDHYYPGLRIKLSAPTGRFPSGRAPFVFVYRYNGQLTTKTYRPDFPSLTLAEVVKFWKIDCGLVAQGIDPQAKRRASRLTRPETVAATLGALFDAWYRNLEQEGRSKNHLDQTRHLFTKNVFSQLKRTTDLTAIERPHIRKVIDDITTSGRRVTANRTRSALRAMYNYALEREIVTVNPAVGLPSKSKETPRDRVLTDSELRTVLLAASTLDYPFGAYIHMLAATALRRSECAALRRTYRDEINDTLILPAEVMKADRPHVVPLTDFTRRILDQCPEIAGCPYFFAGRNGSALAGWSGLKRKLDVAIKAYCSETGAQQPEPFTFHDLRRTATTGMTGLDVPRLIVGKVLAHADRDVTGMHYDQNLYFREKRDALQRWASKLAQLLDPLGNVLPMPKRTA